MDEGDAADETSPLLQRHKERSNIHRKTWRSSKWYIVAVVTLGVFSDICIYSIVIPCNQIVLPDIVSRFGGDAKDIGLLLAFYAVGLLIASPILGIVSDRLNNRKLPMIAGLASLILSTWMFLQAEDYWILATARFLQGVSGGAVWTLGMTLIADTHEREEMGSAMGFVFSGFTLGGLAGPPIGGALYQQLGYSAPFLFCMILAFIDLVGRLALVEPRDDDAKTEDSAVSDIERTNSETHRDSSNESDVTLDPTPKSIWDIMRIPSVIVISVLTAASAIATCSLEVTLPLELNARYGLDTTQVGLVFIALIVPEIIVSPLAGYIYDKAGFHLVSTTGMVFSAIFSFIVAIWQPLSLFIVSLVAFSTAIAFGITPLFAELSECVPPSMYARSYAINNMAYSAGMLVGPVLGSLAYQYSGWFWASMATCIMFVLCIPITFGVRKDTSRNK